MDKQSKQMASPIQNESKSEAFSRREFLRLSATLAMGGAVGLIAAACAPAPAPTAVPAATLPAATAAPAATTAPTVAAVVSRAPLSIKLSSNWFADPGFQKQLRDVISKFHAAQNDIKIEEVSIPNATFADTVTAQMASGKIDGDIIVMLTAMAPPLLNGGFLAPVNDIAAKAGITNALAYTSVPPYLRKGDQVYGLAANLAVDGLMYNTDILKKAGATPPKNRDDFLALATSLTKRPDQFGYAVRHTVAEKVGFIRDMIPWTLGYDGAYAVGKKPTINSQAFINVLTMWRKLYVAAFPQGADAATYRRMMATGVLGMNTDNNALIPTFVGIEPKAKDYITSAPLPWDNHKGAQFSNYAASVVGGGKDKEQAAATFLQFWYKPENFKVWNWAILSPPMMPDANTKDYLDSLPWMGGFATTTPVDNASIYGDFFPFAAEFTNILIQRASEVVVGTVAPEAAAAAAQTELEALGTRVFK